MRGLAASDSHDCSSEVYAVNITTEYSEQTVKRGKKSRDFSLIASLMLPRMQSFPLALRPMVLTLQILSLNALA